MGMPPDKRYYSKPNELASDSGVSYAVGTADKFQLHRQGNVGENAERLEE
jgi:hypothetical protein